LKKARKKKTSSGKNGRTNRSSGTVKWVLVIVSVSAILIWQVYKEPSVNETGLNEGEALVVELPRVSTEIEDPAIAEVIDKALSNLSNATGSVDAWGKLGMIYLVHGYKEEARIAFEAASRLNSENAQWSYYGALTYFPDQLDVGIELLKTANSVFEKEGTTEERRAVKVRLGYVLLESNRYSEAEAEFVEIINDSADYIPALLGLGQIRSIQGRYEESRQLLERCINDASTRKRANQSLAVVYQRLGIEGASAVARQRADRFPSDIQWPDPFLETASEYRTGLTAMLEELSYLIPNGRFVEAKTYLDRITQIYPDSPLGYLAQADYFMRQSDFSGAESALRKGIERDDSNVELWRQLGLALGYQQSFEEAADCLKKVVELNSTSGEARFNLGFSLMSMGQKLEAQKLFEDAIRLEPGLVESYMALAQLHEGAADLSRAKGILEQGLSVKPGDPRLSHAIARVASNMNTLKEGQSKIIQDQVPNE
jgi:tetratricopeptide (TPR) repeat protein